MSFSQQVHEVPGRLRQWSTDPVVYSTIVQIAKTTLAAVIAWVLATRVFGLSQAFMAPWAALLVVHATVYKTVRRGIQQVAANVLGVLLAFAAAGLFAVSPMTFGAALLVALAVGQHRFFGDDGLTIATTVLVVLAAGYSQDSDRLSARLLDVAVGIGVGLIVNLAVWPPLGDRSAARQVDAIDDRLGAVFTDIARDIRAGYDNESATRWIELTNQLDDDIDRAWSFVNEASESGRFNFRGKRLTTEAGQSFADVLRRLEQAVAETRSMAMTLQRESEDAHTWSADFREPWLNMLRDLGSAVSDADADALDALTWRVRDLCNDLAAHDAEDDAWPVYGALLVNLRNISGSLDAVAAAQPIVSPRDRDTGERRSSRGRG